MGSSRAWNFGALPATHAGGDVCGATRHSHAAVVAKAG